MMGEPIKIYKDGKEQLVYGRAQRDLLIAEGWQAEKAAESKAAATVDATDAALKLAADNNIDLSTVKGSGKDGRITVDDVQALLGE